MDERNQNHVSLTLPICLWRWIWVETIQCIRPATMRGLPISADNRDREQKRWQEWSRDEWVAKARNLPRETVHRYRQLSRTSKVRCGATL